MSQLRNLLQASYKYLQPESEILVRHSRCKLWSGSQACWKQFSACWLLFYFCRCLNKFLILLNHLYLEAKWGKPSHSIIILRFYPNLLVLGISGLGLFFIWLHLEQRLLLHSYWLWYLEVSIAVCTTNNSENKLFAWQVIRNIFMVTM